MEAGVSEWEMIYVDGNRGQSDAGPQAKKCRQPLETGKGKKEKDLGI